MTVSLKERMIHNICYPLFLCYFFCLVDRSIGGSGVLKSPAMNVWCLMSNLTFSNVSFTNMGALVFRGLMFRVETSSWWISPVMNGKFLLLPFGLPLV